MKKLVEAPITVLIKSDGAKITIFFVCQECRRMTIFTNNWSRGESGKMQMRCSECNCEVFQILGMEG